MDGKKNAGACAGPGPAPKLYLVIFTAAALPVAVFAACLSPFGLGPTASAAAAAGAALLSSLAAGRLVSKGLADPVCRAAAGIRDFITAGYKLEAPLLKDGWPESAALVSAVNRLMLELGAYRAFQLNQVVDERGKAQALIETIPDGVLLSDDAGKIIYCNRAALELLGIPKLSPAAALPDSVTSPAFLPAVTRIMASAEKLLKLEVPVPHPSGAGVPPRTFLAISSQFLLATLKRPGRVLLLRDITTEKEMENTKQTFFQMITHDMRAPLSSILGYAQCLGKMAAKTPAGDNCLETIERATRRLNGMIEDILNITKMERGDMTLRLQDMDAGKLIERVREFYGPEAARKKISLSAPAPSERTEFGGDPELLERVITNLLSNALKFTPSGGSISLYCGSAPGEVRFTVQDTGPGIPADKLALVFEKYAQMEEHRSLGFGLGLAMCKMAVELHEGRIWVESEPGKGSTFIFTIPRTGTPA
ncbi:MAG: PAS domain-containing protein [Elusimicrobia bacterium]|nr:PAS domain-containing protein [Elusimicrobiota bacterium]